ncbi:MAG: hypothetical protein J7598_23930 [Mitsuaria chitosanitabida]|nr:hypothetical protein [Roseateles chitosanitabidus]
MPTPLPASLLLDMPAGRQDPVPTLVLAPGASYHLRKPLMDRLARVLCERGIAVLRFNWAYLDVTPKGAPSDDLSVELAELQAVIAFARDDARLRTDRLVVAGKSMGSVVAARAFAADASLAGAVLLTPLLSQPGAAPLATTDGAERYYGELRADHRPSLLVSGDQDPYCDPRDLHRFATASTAAMRVAVVDGDHGFGTPGLTGDAADAALARSHDVVARRVADFMDTAFG